MLCVFKHVIGMFTFILDATIIFIYNIHTHYFTLVVHSTYLAFVVLNKLSVTKQEVGTKEAERKERESKGERWREITSGR